MPELFRPVALAFILAVLLILATLGGPPGSGPSPALARKMAAPVEVSREGGGGTTGAAAVRAPLPPRDLPLRRVAMSEQHPPVRQAASREGVE